jgi:hypothetical protein
MLPPRLRFLRAEEMREVPGIPALATGSHLFARLAPEVARPVPRVPTFREGTQPLDLPPVRVTRPELRLSVIRDALLLGGAVADGQGRLLSDSVSHLGTALEGQGALHAEWLAPFALAVEPDGFAPTRWLLRPAQGHLREPLFHLTYPRDHTYTHFLQDVLPRLAIHRALPEPRPRLLVSEAVARDRAGMLAALGVRAEELVVAPARGWLRADAVFVAGAPMWLEEGCLAALRALAGPPRPSGRRFYIRRTGAKAWFRNLLNEEAAMARLRRRGFRPLVPEEHSVARQVALFRGAEAVAGVFGGGLLNAVFAEPGLRLLSLTSTAYWRPSLDSAAPVAGWQAAQVVGDAFLAPRDPNNSAFVIDLDALDAACDRLGL